MTTQQRRLQWLPVVALFFTAPLVAEFLLGDFSIKMLPILIPLAPLYGGGALLIRELARRTGRGWPTILVLGTAYGVLEEAFATQSFFDPNYLKMNLGLLRPAFIPALGIGAWWTVWVLMVHAIWSIATPIALIEACFPDRARAPWLGRWGLLAVVPLYILGMVSTTITSYRMGHYMATRAQFAWAGVAAVVLIAIAFLIPARGPSAAREEAPSAWALGAISLVLASIAIVVPNAWGWGAVAALLGTVVAMVLVVMWWMRRGQLSILHQLAMAAGAAVTYGWHAFLMRPAIGTVDTTYRVGNGVFLAGATALVWFGARRSRKSALSESGARVLA